MVRREWIVGLVLLLVVIVAGGCSTDYIVIKKTVNGLGSTGNSNTLLDAPMCEDDACGTYYDIMYLE